MLYHAEVNCTHTKKKKGETKQHKFLCHFKCRMLGASLKDCPAFTGENTHIFYCLSHYGPNTFWPHMWHSYPFKDVPLGFCAVPLIFQASETEICHSTLLHIIFNTIKHTSVPSINFKNHVYYKKNYNLSNSSCENSTSLEEGTWRRPYRLAVRRQLTANTFSQSEHLALPLKPVNGK